MKPTLSLRSHQNKTRSEDIQLIPLLKQTYGFVCQLESYSRIDGNGEEFTGDDVLKMITNQATDLLTMKMRVTGTI